MRSHHFVFLGFLALLACPAPTATNEAIAPTTEPKPTAADPDGPKSAWADAMPLVRGEGHRVDITEVWVDPLATAALSLDGSGSVRLWPAFELASPVALPLTEPVALSFARTTGDAFLIAAIDTSQGGRVIEVRVDPSGHAEMIERFTIPPSDPLFELHVLDDGERLLALGVDHRLRLYDRTGKLLDELNEHGFAPWQLRIVGRGDARKLAVVLAQPTRVQTLTLTGDELAVAGEPRRVRNDRGANLNDLQLTSDGRHVTSFRRPTSKSHEWTLELLELATGQVRVLRGEVGGTIRPRLHMIDENRALLEDGEGAGYWIDLRGGVVQPAGFELPEDLDDLPPEAKVGAKQVPLAYSIERQRWHSTIVEGMRVVPDGRALILDPIESDVHHRLGHPHARMQSVGFTADGSKVAWTMNEQGWFESLAQPSQLEPLPAEDASYTWAIDESRGAVDGQGRVYEAEKGLDPTLTIRDSQGREARMVFDDVRIDSVLPSPDGRWLAVVERRRGGWLEDWDREPDTLTVVLHSMAELPEKPTKLWSLELVGDHGHSIVWSPTSKQLAIAEAEVGGMVLTPSGELLLERRHGLLGYETANDAEVAAPQIAELKERQRIERERARNGF